MNHFPALLAATLLTLAGAHAVAQTADAKPKAAAKPAAKSAKPAPKPATARQQLKSQAKGLALAAETVETITDSQLEIAGKVMTGDAQCEFNQQVKVSPLEGHPGHFKVVFKTSQWVMTPEETTTGAVRLFDRKAGVTWLQIPFKSMLMNSKVGQRLVDSCMLAEQRAATQAATLAAAPPTLIRAEGAVMPAPAPGATTLQPMAVPEPTLIVILPPAPAASDAAATPLPVMISPPAPLPAEPMAAQAPTPPVEPGTPKP